MRTHPLASLIRVLLILVLAGCASTDATGIQPSESPSPSAKIPIRMELLLSTGMGDEWQLISNGTPVSHGNPSDTAVFQGIPLKFGVDRTDPAAKVWRVTFENFDVTGCTQSIVMQAYTEGGTVPPQATAMLTDNQTFSIAMDPIKVGWARMKLACPTG